MKKLAKSKIRMPVLEKYKPIWLTKEAHEILRKQKKTQEKSMAEIVNNLILEKYGTMQTPNVGRNKPAKSQVS